MGEIADMMLDGTLCEGCGAYLDQEPQGFPGYCSPACAGDRGVLQGVMKPKKQRTPEQRAKLRRKEKAKKARRRERAAAAAAEAAK